MQLTQLTVVVLFLVMKICRAKIVTTTANPVESTSTIVEDLVSILTSCYRDRMSAIGFTGNLPGTLLRTLSTQHLIPVVLIDSIMNPTDKPHYVPIRFRHKLQVFVVEASSFRHLINIIERKIKLSIWWNHMASFFILDRVSECANAPEYLFIAWHFNILNAKVICKLHDRTTIVSFNPFTRLAPASWQLIDKVFPGERNHPFTVFNREYRENNSICVDLEYEKTNDLGGYGIRVEGPPVIYMKYDKINANDYKFWVTNERILNTVYRAINATPHFSGNTRFDLPDTEDMVKTTRVMTFTWDKVLITYPHDQIGLIFISQFRGHKSQLDKIISIIDIYSRYGLGVVYVVTLIFLKVFVRQTLMPALLNLTRITCGAGLANLPANTASRIYVTSLLFFAVTMLGIYQGNLASLLTTKVPLRNVDTVKDIVDLNYRIYGTPAMRSMIDNQELRKSYINIHNSYDCIMNVVHDSSGVCVWVGDGSVLDGAREFKLHISSHYVVRIYIGFEIHWDWALEERINTIIARMREADVLQPWQIKCNPTELSEYEFDEEVKKNTTHKVLELGELLFAFAILAIGLTCATVVFIAELVVYRLQTRTTIVRVQVLR